MDYNPTSDLYDGIKSAWPIETYPWDDYFARMAETDYLLGRGNVIGGKSYFVRKAPFNGSFILLGGITAALRIINEIRFDTPEFAQGMIDIGYKREFLDDLKKLGKFRNLKVHAASEGTAFFPNEPIVSIEGPAVEVRLADGIIIECCNFASLSMTKWRRSVMVAQPGGVLEFARRRAQNPMETSLCAILAGCIATSNSNIRRHFVYAVRGTMGHEWMQSFATVEEAFDAWLSVHPDLPIGLVDTVQCMERDFPAWLDAVYKHRDAIKAANPAIWGWRDDSGDLAYLTIEQYARFLQHPLAQDPWFVERMRIFLTNELDEYALTAIIGQVSTQARAAGFDAEDILRRIIWAEGTKPGVCEDNPSLGGVMKLVEWDGRACIKLALDADGRVGVKTSIPGLNFSAMVGNGTQNLGVLVYPRQRYHITPNGKLYDHVNNHPVEVLRACHPDNEKLVHELTDYRLTARQSLVYDGELTQQWQDTRPTIESVQQRVKETTESLPWYYTRIENPHVFPVSVAPDLFGLRKRMIRNSELQADYLPF